MGISEKNESPLERVEYLARTHTRRDAETDARSYALGLRIIGKKLPRREGRPEHRATDSRRQTRRKHSSRSLERLNLSSRYFLKRLKAEISPNAKFPWGIERSSGDLCDAKLFSANNPRPEIRRGKENQRTEHCETNSDARN